MTKRYQKWRELATDPFAITFKKVKLNKILSYLPAGNDVLECEFEINNQLVELFLKIERSKVVDFKTEVKHLKKLSKHKYYLKIPKVIEDGYIEKKKYIVLEKKEGTRLSEIFESDATNRKQYLTLYGKELGKLHKINYKDFSIAKIRIINDIPTKDNYNIPDEIIPYINYLKENPITKEPNCFIHGDFHYANILWKKEEVEAVLDFEYSGQGLKEQDIAWACILRPNQKFMDNLEEIISFLNGYKIENEFNFYNFKWCLINGYCHFYLMNQQDELYKKKLRKLLTEVINIDSL